MHPNAELLQRLFAAFAAGDLETVRASLADDIVWETPGRSLLAGRRSGVEEVLDHLGRAGALSDGTYTTEVHDVLASDRHVVVLYTGHAERGGRAGSFGVVAVYSVDGDRVTHVSAVPRDAYAFDDFWS